VNAGRGGKIAMSKSIVLLPVPRRMREANAGCPVDAIRGIVIQGDAAGMLGAARRLQAAVREEAAVAWMLRAADTGERRGKGLAWLALDPTGGIAPQGYRLRIDANGLTLTAGDAAGLFYGVMTLVQVLRQARGRLPGLAIDDHPDFASRGVMLDVSRDKVPTLETLFALIDQLAALKINHVELYTEHTFAYRRHREVWAQSGAYTGEDMLLLDAYCRERFMELVPNQNSFGHLGRWLNLPAYRDLAEAPDGFDFPWGRSQGPFSLNPSDPRSLQLLAGWYDELLPHFSSLKLNVGGDETWDLGQGKSKALCEARGKGRVYLDFLLKIYDLVKTRGRIPHFWGDIILHHPELVKDLPKDMVVLEWGYEANHPFAEHAAKFADSGLPFYVCPGTSSWGSIAGRTDNALANLRSAAESGSRHGAIGFLNTDWGDGGHWQYLPVSYLAFAAGAAQAWTCAASRGLDLPRALDVHVFKDAAGVMGRLAHDLGNVYLLVGRQRDNGSLLNDLLRIGLEKVPSATPSKTLAGITPKTLAATRDAIDGIMAALPRARMVRADADTVHDEFSNAARMLRHACARGDMLCNPGRATAALKRRLASDMGDILGEHRRLWVARNRVGGLQDSTRVFEERLKEYSDA
jgi:hexosaminidase